MGVLLDHALPVLVNNRQRTTNTNTMSPEITSSVHFQGQDMACLKVAPRMHRRPLAEE